MNIYIEFFILVCMFMKLFCYDYRMLFDTRYREKKEENSTRSRGQDVFLFLAKRKSEHEITKERKISKSLLLSKSNEIDKYRTNTTDEGF